MGRTSHVLLGETRCADSGRSGHDEAGVPTVGPDTLELGQLALTSRQRPPHDGHIIGKHIHTTSVNIFTKMSYLRCNLSNSAVMSSDYSFPLPEPSLGLTLTEQGET